MHFCPFETVAREALGLFQFHVFGGEGDFQIYEYAWDFEEFYCTEYGGPLEAVQGVGYLSELIGCPANSPAHHDLRTSKTLLSFPETFPLNRKMYVDVSQDKFMAAVFAAMDLFGQLNGPLDATKIT